jgi:hypothetical protein
LGAVVDLYGKDPAQAASIWLALDSVETELGGGETFAGSLWVLLVRWAALRAGGLPRALNYFGVVIGVAGILTTVVPALEVVGIVFGLGFIVSTRMAISSPVDRFRVPKNLTLSRPGCTRTAGDYFPGQRQRGFQDETSFTSSGIQKQKTSSPAMVW